MSPVEKFKPSEYSFYDKLDATVKDVCNEHGLIEVHDGEDEQTLEEYRIYIIGSSEADALPVVLIGHDSSKSYKISDLDTNKRPHKLIGPQEIIDEVKLKLSKESPVKV